jgi:uncharacterized protein (TIGR04206 family)
MGDDLTAIETALCNALASLPWMLFNAEEIDLVPAFAPRGFYATVARIDVELWQYPARTKEGLQELAAAWGLRRTRGAGGCPPAPNRHRCSSIDTTS